MLVFRLLLVSRKRGLVKRVLLLTENKVQGHCISSGKLIRVSRQIRVVIFWNKLGY